MSAAMRPDSENFHFSWVLQNFVDKSEKLRSPVFLGGTVSQHKWDLELNPKEKGPDGTEQISIMLRMIQRGKNFAESTEINATVDCILRFNTEYRLKKTSEVNFTKQPQFIKWTWKKDEVFSVEMDKNLPVKVICRISLKNKEAKTPEELPKLRSPKRQVGEANNSPTKQGNETKSPVKPELKKNEPSEVIPSTSSSFTNGGTLKPNPFRTPSSGRGRGRPKGRRGRGRPPGSKNKSNIKPSVGETPPPVLTPPEQPTTSEGRKRGPPNRFLPEEGVEIPVKKTRILPKMATPEDAKPITNGQISPNISTNTNKALEVNDFNLGEMLLTDGLFDGSLIVGDREFKIHKAVLSCQSTFFREEFAKGTILSNISLSELKPDAFEVALRFAYFGGFRSEDDNLSGAALTQVLGVAEKCGMKRLKDACINRVLNLRELNAEVGLHLVEIASSGDSEELLDNVLNLVKPIYSEMKKLPKWREIVLDPKHQKMIQRLVLMLDC